VRSASQHPQQQQQQQYATIHVSCTQLPMDAAWDSVAELMRLRRYAAAAAGVCH